MRIVLTLCMCLLFLFMTETSHALEVRITKYIPGRYALLVFTGVDPNVPLDKEKIAAITPPGSARRSPRRPALRPCGSAFPGSRHWNLGCRPCSVALRYC